MLFRHELYQFFISSMLFSFCYILSHYFWLQWNPFYCPCSIAMYYLFSIILYILLPNMIYEISIYLCVANSSFIIIHHSRCFHLIFRNCYHPSTAMLLVMYCCLLEVWLGNNGRKFFTCFLWVSVQWSIPETIFVKNHIYGLIQLQL